MIKNTFNGNEIRESVSKEMIESAEWVKNAAFKLDNPNNGETEQLVKKLLRAKKIFLMGSGRSGLVARAFAMRLMHLGFPVHVIGETTTPAVESKDLAIVISGGGETDEMVANAEVILNIGAQLITITSVKESTLGKKAGHTVILPGRTKEDSTIDYKERRLKGGPVAPLGTLFEIISLIYLDALIPLLMEITEQSEIEMKQRHARPG